MTRNLAPSPYSKEKFEAGGLYSVGGKARNVLPMAETMG